MHSAADCWLVLGFFCLASGAGGAQDKAPVIAWPAPASIVYGTPLSGAQLNAAANVPGEFTYGPAAGTVLPAGTHSLFVSFHPAVTAYTDALASTHLTVTKAILRVRAENQSRADGQSNPAFTYRFSGFRNGENATALSQAPQCTTAATPASPPGPYPITCLGAKAANYGFVYVDGVLTVTK